MDRKILATHCKAIMLVITLSIIVAPIGHTQHWVQDGLRRLLYDHEANHTTIDEQSLSEFGIPDDDSRINVSTGELVLRHTDIDIPGNSALPVRFTRIIDSDPNRPSFLGNPASKTSRGLANWKVDLPYILLSSVHSGGTAGCISDSTVLGVKDELFVAPIVYIEGKKLNLLKTANSSNSNHFGTSSPKYTTSESMKIEQVKSGNSCKWTVTTTDGIKYEFGQVNILETKNGKIKHAMLITLITDPHGNYVRYTYDGRNKRLTKITSNDNRVIKMVYNRDGTLECAVANPDSKTTTKRIIYYKYQPASKRGQKTLYKAGINNTGIFYQYNGLAGIYSHQENDYARRCRFGTGARIRYPTGLIVNIETKKIVNFVEAESPDGHKSTSHRAACLKPITEPPDPLAPENIGLEFLNPWPSPRPVRTMSITDGSSKYGKFSTYFTSAVTRLTVTDEKNKTYIWKFEYDEGDEYKSVPSSDSSQSVHKNASKPVYVDITKPKKRTTIYPDGSKRVYMVGRSLKDTGLLISKEIFDKGSTTAAMKAEYVYEHSTKPLGKAWNRNHLNRRLAEHRTRLSKEVMTLNGTAYTTKHEYDSYGFPTKTTKSSTLQSGSIIELTDYSHNKSKWILGLVKTRTVNGKEILSLSYDTAGNKILETRMGSQFKRYRWSGSRLKAERNGGNETTSFKSHKRGIPQKTTFANGAVVLKEVDDNGWVTKITKPSGYVEEYTYDMAGRETEIDRVAGYADTTISYTNPVTRNYHIRAGILLTEAKGIIKTETTGENKQKIIKKTTFNWYGSPILIETRDVANNVSIFVRIAYDELGREIFRSFPSYSQTETSGFRTKYDVLGRKIEERDRVAPFVKKTHEYLSNNRVRTTDAEGNSTTVSRSGYGSPYDGKEIKIIEPNGMIIYKRHDKLQNLIEERHVSAGKTRTSKFKFNSRNQLCFESLPDVGTKSIAFDDSGRVSREDHGVNDNYVCPTPSRIVITSFAPTKSPSTSPSTSPKTTPSTTPSTKPSTTPSTPQNKCPPGEVWNGAECIGTTRTFLREPSESGIQTTYNVFGQKTFINFPSENTPDIRKTYDLEGRVTKIVRGNVTLEYTYGKRSELLTEKLSIVETDEKKQTTTKTYKVTYTYNTTGGLSSYTTALNRVINFSLNAFNQPTDLTVLGQKYISGVKYHANGDIKSALLHNTNQSKKNETIEFTSTLNSQMLQSSFKLEEDSESDTVPVFSFSITYDKNHRVKKVKRLAGTVTYGDREFGYDKMSQVISVSGDNKNITFSFDSFENMIARTEGSESQKNNFNLTSGKLNETYEETANSDGLKKIENPISISHDKRGRITKFGKFTLVLDDANRINSVDEEHFSQNNLYDGSHNRVLAIYTKSSEPQSKSFEYRLVSKSGRLLHRSLKYENADKNSRIYAGPPEDYDLIEFGNSLTLKYGDCATWNIQLSQNNLFVALNADNSVFGISSADPFGNLISSWGSAKKDCEPHPVWKPIWPFKIPVYPGYFRIPSPDPVNANLSNKNNEQKRQIIFREITPDSVTQFYLLRKSRFYSSIIGRYLAPEYPSPYSANKQVPTNWYSLAGNNPVNYYFKFEAENSNALIESLVNDRVNQPRSSFQYLRR